MLQRFQLFFRKAGSFSDGFKREALGFEVGGDFDQFFPPFLSPFFPPFFSSFFSSFLDALVACVLNLIVYVAFCSHIVKIFLFLFWSEISNIR